MKTYILHSLFIVMAALPAWADSSLTSPLCQSTQNQISFARQLEVRHSSDELSVITWNAHKLADPQFVQDLSELSESSDVIMIQEAMHSTQIQNYFSSNFNFSFSFHKSFCDRNNQATGVMNASRYTLENNQTLVSSLTEPFTHTPKVSGYSALQIPEIGTVHIINTHGLNFNTGRRFREQMNEISAFIRQLQGPVIWAGDFNTWSPGRKEHLNMRTAELGLTHLRPSGDNRNLKLDHIYVRGLELISVEMLNNYRSSDHLPIRAVFRKVPAQMYESLDVDLADVATDTDNQTALRPDSDN